jgi:hypothetical protein
VSTVTDREFDANDYRKRVLAAVERRGGPDASDPFELYDLSPVGELDDRAVAAQVDAVWAFWQRQRDHPKYRILVAQLVKGHAERSAELLDPGRRRLAAARVRAQREQRDAERFALLDAAISRLVDRHGCVPRDKVAGLREVGALSGLSDEEVATRLRRHRIGDGPPGPPASAAPAISADRRRQLRALLAEFGRLTETAAPPTLLALLELPPSATGEQLRARAGAWRSRSRELPPGRLRAVVDELLVHVAELLETGPGTVATYLSAVAADVAEYLRPRVRAAVLVEDRLVASDREHLLDEAMQLGLDRPRAEAVLAAVAAELGAAVEGDPVEGHPVEGAAVEGAAVEAAAAGPGPDRRWEERLREARAALRAGRAVAAARLAAEAEGLAGTAGRTQVRAVADEAATVLAEAQRRWRVATGEGAARRFVAALPHLEHVARTASDLPIAAELAALLARAQAAVERADRAVAAAVAGPERQRAAALLAVLAECPEHPGAVAALARIPVAAPTWVNAARDARGDVVVLWAPSATPAVTYKVSRLRPDGSWQVVGRVTDPTLVDGGAPVGVEAPVYAVLAVQQGRTSAECRSDSVPTAQPPPPVNVAAGGPVPPRAVSATRIDGGSVRVSWTGSGDVEYRVRCLVADGRWRVVGRTRATWIEDGGAPAGPAGVYAVSAAGAGGDRSAEVRSDGE